MDRGKIARRRLAELTDPEDRLDLILTADLGDELVAMLPWLVDAGACSFAVYNTACDKFAMDGIEPDHNGLYVWLEIHLGTAHASVNFAGLMQQFADAHKAAEIVEAIIKRSLVQGDYYAAFTVQMCDGDVFAMRTHCPTSARRDCVELSVVYHALTEFSGVGVALGLIPGGRTTHRVPAEQQLVPVAEYLKSVGVAQIIIDEMVELIFKDESTLGSLDKVVALAAIHEGSGTRTRQDLLRRQFQHILGLHFASTRLVARSSNMKWLIHNGLFDRKSIRYDVAKRAELDHALQCPLSHGRLAAVFQFLLAFMTEWEQGKHLHRSVGLAQAYVESLLPGAFKCAMTDRRYGTAAAIAQICSTISDEDRIRSLELAIAYRQRIRLESIFYRLE